MNKNNLIKSLIAILIFTSCKSTKPVASTVVLKNEKTVILQVNSLEAINLEEDLTFADEIVLTYSLTAVDENNKVIQVANGSFGVESMKKGAIVLRERFKPIELIVPVNSKVLSSVVLTEIEDYKKAQNTVLKLILLEDYPKSLPFSLVWESTKLPWQ